MKNFFQIKCAALLTFAEGIALICFASFVLISSIKSGFIERWETLIAEVFLYLLLAGITIYISREISNFRKRFFTPFLLIQLFVIIIGFPLIQDDQRLTQGLGCVIVLIASYSLIAGLIPVNRNKFL
jgi:uncharacterized membrane protein